MTDKRALRWKISPILESLLPPPITRAYIQTPNGPLELLVAQPSVTAQPRKKAILFQHGGFGAAAMWIPFLLYFSQTHGYPCYAISLRGHGASWKPGFFRMVFATGKASMAQDLNYAFKWVQEYEAEYRQGHINPEDIILVGHSAGGGLCQYFLSHNLGKVGGLVLMAAFPCFGGLGVYWNWARLDPFFFVRMCFRDFGHPRSPLSSTTLVHRAFFCSAFPVSHVREFETYMPDFESLLWPMGMMFTFVNIRNVLKNIISRHTVVKGRVLVLGGSEDNLMSVKLMRRMVEQYRRIFKDLMGHWYLREDLDATEIDRSRIDEYSSSAIRFGIVQGSGHHIQNDLQWEDGASQVLAFIEGL